MAETLWTVFLAVTAVAVLIQSGILLGLFFLLRKLNRQADHALDLTRNLLGPIQTVIDSLRVASNRFAEFSSRTQQRVSELEQRSKRRTA